MDVSKQLVIKHCFFTKLELGAGKYSYKKGSFYAFWLDIALNFCRFFVYFSAQATFVCKHNYCKHVEEG